MAPLASQVLAPTRRPVRPLRHGTARPRLLAAVAALLLGAAPAAFAGDTERVSVDSDGVGGDAQSANPAISANGRFVAFRADATNLVAGDENLVEDVFLRDRKKGTTTRVSVDPDGGDGNGQSTNASISASGRFVAFQSSATNLVPDDTNDRADVFVRDVKKGTTTRVSLDSDGGQANSHCTLPAISANGRYVAFRSDATNLVDGDTNGALDVFVHDRKKGTTERVSVASDGTQADTNVFTLAISGNGRFVAFETGATTLVPDDTNGKVDVFVHDRKKGTTTRVSVGPDGLEADGASRGPSLSASGRSVAFHSDATNLVDGDANDAADVFVHDLVKGTTTLVSADADGAVGDSDSFGTSITANGRWVAFASIATNLVADEVSGRDNVYVRDLKKGTTMLVSVDSAGNQGDAFADAPSIAAKGRWVAFESDSTDLVSGDTNDAYDVFVHDTK